MVLKKYKTMEKKEFINAGFNVVGEENNENKLWKFLKENYPNVIRDNELKLDELKNILGLPIDEKVNGYGLNFVGRNFARAKYAQKTEKELQLNTKRSKNIDTTQNLVLKGDNLDSLKILKSHYTNKIKCIYIDPPYNTTKDEFVYPDKFDKEEAEVLGLQNLSEEDFDRMDFSFKTKKSHNGWLAFMYPRLLLARDLLSKDGVIFISIDDNEQANLKLLCDEIFGEENFVANMIWQSRTSISNDQEVSLNHNHTFIYAKDRKQLVFLGEKLNKKEYSNPDNDPRGKWKLVPLDANKQGGDTKYPIKNPKTEEIYYPPNNRCWTINSQEYKRLFNDGRIMFGTKGESAPKRKIFLAEREAKGDTKTPSSIILKGGTTKDGTTEVIELFDNKKSFSYPKPTKLLKKIVQYGTRNNSNDIILDFFAGSGTTGEAVMRLNAEDEGNRKFILCQIDEPIKKGEPAYEFCIENNLEPVISSITIERLKRAGDKIAKEIEEENSKSGMFEEDKKQVPDIGFKVFDSVETPKLQVDENSLQISIQENGIDTLSRIYNMIFTVGLDEPTQVPEMVVENCIYKLGDHYYITNSEKISKEDFAEVIKKGNVFIDGWTASLNGTLQHYKEDIKIVF